jgi:hypothetical protein
MGLSPILYRPYQISMDRYLDERDQNKLSIHLIIDVS